MTLEVTEHEPMTRSAVKGAPAPVPMQGSYEFEPCDGGTRFTTTFDTEAHRLFKLAEPVFARLRARVGDVLRHAQGRARGRRTTVTIPGRTPVERIAMAPDPSLPTAPARPPGARAAARPAAVRARRRARRRSTSRPTTRCSPTSRAPAARSTSRRSSSTRPRWRELKAAGVKLAVPLVSQGELIGVLNLGPRLSEQEYSSDDRELLDNLAAQAAPGAAGGPARAPAAGRGARPASASSRSSRSPG